MRPERLVTKTNMMQYTKLIPAEPTASDLAFEQFRQIFPVVNCRVALDGSYQNYQLPNQSSLFRNLTEAKRIITQQKLPLEVKAFSDYCRNVLHITYKNAAV